MTFANTEYFYLGFTLLAVVVLVVYSFFKRKGSLERFAGTKTLQTLMQRYSPTLRLCAFLLTLAAAVLLIFMIARPRSGIVEQEETRHGIEAVIMVDVSNSMQATDVAPSRLETAKFLLNSLIDNMQDDKIALGIFAGEAYMQLPITSDYSAAKSMVNSLSPSMISMQGTHIAAALDMANHGFSENRKGDKAIILITDGENHEGNVEEVIRKLVKEKRKLFILGIGTPQGSTIPTGNGPLLDENGEPVVSALNEELLSSIATQAGGKYIHVENALTAQEQLEAELSHLQASTENGKYRTYDEKFQGFGIAAFILLLLAMLWWRDQ